MKTQFEQGRVYTLSYSCDTPGPEIEEGTIPAYWTGEVDQWGKYTFISVNGDGPYYLFVREIVSMEPV